MAVERVMLRHKEHGGYWNCPVEAVDDYLKLGWQPTDDTPVEPNPMTAEMPRERLAPVPGPEPEKSTKSKPRDAGSTEKGSD